MATKRTPYRDPKTGRFAKRPEPVPVALPPRRPRRWLTLAVGAVAALATLTATLGGSSVDAAVVARCTRSADAWTVEAARRTALTGRRHTTEQVREACRLAATTR